MAFVYIHKRKDNNEVFYVGRGTNKYRPYSKANRNKYWHNIVNKAGYTVEIVADNLSWEEAGILETELIKQYGRKDMNEGTLVNMSDGGEGNCRGRTRTGMPHLEETKKEISNSNKGKKHTEETKNILREKSKGNKNMLGKKHSKETKEKISKAFKGKKLSDEHVEKIRNAVSNMSQDTKDKISNTLKGIVRSEETRRKMSEARKRTVELKRSKNK